MTSDVSRPFCSCRQHGPKFPDAKVLKHLGEDPGTLAEVQLVICAKCDEYWVTLIDEDRPGHGRWCAALVKPALLHAITAANAADHVRRQPWYVYGGRHFGHTGRRATFPPRWL